MESNILQPGFIIIKGRELVSGQDIEVLTPDDIDFDAEVYYDPSVWRFWGMNKNKKMIDRLKKVSKNER